MRGSRLKQMVYSIGTGAFAVFLFLLIYFAANRNVAPFMLILREVFPLYEDGVSSVMNLYAYGGDVEIAENFDPGNDTPDMAFKTVTENLPGDLNNVDDISAPLEPAQPVQPAQPAQQDQDRVGENSVQNPEITLNTEIIGLNNVIYQPETDMSIIDNSHVEPFTRNDLSGLSILNDFDYIKSALYTVDKRTDLLSSDIDIGAFLSKSFKIDTSSRGPKVLIFHTHSQEAYSDSANDINDGIFAVGDRLKELLETKYGIETLHDKSSYDIVEGKSSTLGAYERMEPSITEILNKNPSVELVIDMHRDGVPEETRLVTSVNGKQTAKIMFFNGLCRIYKNGVLAGTEGLTNNYVNDNLALSLNLQLLANELFPGLTRKIYINAYRYSLHFKPKSLLIEVGAQTNTKQEALNAMEPLAEMLAKTIK